MIVGIAFDGPHTGLAFVACFGEQPGVVVFKDPAGDSQAGLLGLLGIRSQTSTLHKVNHVHLPVVEPDFKHLGSASDLGDCGANRLVRGGRECLQRCEVEKLKHFQLLAGQRLGHPLRVGLNLG